MFLGLGVGEAVGGGRDAVLRRGGRSRSRPAMWCRAIRWAGAGHVGSLPGRLLPGAAPTPVR